MKRRALAMLAPQSASPDLLFSQTLFSALSGNHPRRQPETAASVAKWNLAPSPPFYQARFADASNFTFVFVGSFTLETIRPLVETYVASLPATHARETWRDQGVRPPSPPPTRARRGGTGASDRPPASSRLRCERGLRRGARWQSCSADRSSSR